MYIDDILTSGTQGRLILELHECNMDYSVVKTNANKTTIIVVFISHWLLSKNGGSMTTKPGLPVMIALKNTQLFPGFSLTDNFIFPDHHGKMMTITVA